MSILYNEWDSATAAWLEKLIEHGSLPEGTVDTHSVTDLAAEDVSSYQQVHFFAGIGGWPLAIRWAGLEGVSGIWTGSPPCQPFSVAGLRKGKEDERHLAPVWLGLIRECLPPVIFGEQVEAAIRHGWLDDLFTELERDGYACGAAVLPACGAGAPHLRKRIFFGAVRMADLHGNRCHSGRKIQSVCKESDVEHGGAACFMGNSHDKHQQAAGQYKKRSKLTGRTGETGIVADFNCTRSPRWSFLPERGDEKPIGPDGVDGELCDQIYQSWRDSDWLGCRDGKFRPVEPGTFPMADGIPARVGRLRGYGNAIVPQVATKFITAFMAAARKATTHGE